MGGGGVSDVGESGGGTSAVLGSGEDGHDLIETSIDLSVPDVHLSISAKEFSDLGESTGVTVCVVPCHEVSNGLASDKLPHFHHDWTLIVAHVPLGDRDERPHVVSKRDFGTSSDRDHRLESDA